MTNHFDLNDDEFERQFATCTFNPKLFNHEAHLRLAYIHVTKYGVYQAADNLCVQIKRFDKTYGDGTKFHKTITVASAKTMDHFIRKSKSTSFAELLEEFPRLRYNFMDLLSFHYGFDLFHNKEAKAQFMEPDLLPFN